MLKRIPHSSQDISGEPKTKEYVQHHQKYARLQFKAFMGELAQEYIHRQLPPDGRFLEIGPGPGFLTAFMAEQYPQAEMNALELSADMISTAKEVVGKTQPACRVRFIAGSVDDKSLMIHLGKFDLVYSTFSLHHWEKPVQAIKTMYRALKEGGLMMLHDLKRVPWLYLLPVRNGFIDSIRAAYRPGEIRHMLSEAGIGIHDAAVKTPFPYFWHTILITK
jgi:ubiquinone/menaquinone biosynthesis C-methylase UbiE